MRGVFLIYPFLLALISEADATSSDIGDPVNFFTKYCFEANRLNGRSRRPPAESGWVAADRKLRRSLGIPHDPTADVYMRKPADDDTALILRIAERTVARGIARDQRSHACEVIYSGPKDGSTLLREISAMLGADGFPNTASSQLWAREVPEGWRQWCWSSNPSRRSKKWRPDNRGCTVVTAPSFYNDMQLVQVFLKAKKGIDPPVSIIGLYWTFRPARDAPKPKPVVGVEPLGSAEERERAQSDKNGTKKN